MTFRTIKGRVGCMIQIRKKIQGAACWAFAWLHFFIYHLCITTLGFGSAFHSRTLLLRETTNAHADLLAQAQNEISQRVNALRDIGAQLSLQADVKKAMYYDNTPDAVELETYKRITNQLVSLKYTNSYINDLYLYFRRADIISSTAGKSTPNTYLNVLKNYETTQPFWDYIDNGVIFSTISMQVCHRKLSKRYLSESAQWSDRLFGLLPESDF